MMGGFGSGDPNSLALEGVEQGPREVGLGRPTQSLWGHPSVGGGGSRIVDTSQHATRWGCSLAQQSISRGI